MHEAIEPQLWITKLFNEYLGGVGNSILDMVHLRHDPHAPWANFVCMELLVALIVVVLFAVLRPRLSADNPGKLQHTFEMVYQFLHGESEEQVGHSGPHYIAFFGTLFIFILFTNWFGLIPGVGTIGWGVPNAHGELTHISTPLLRGTNADLNMTFSMSLIFFAQVMV